MAAYYTVPVVRPSRLCRGREERRERKKGGGGGERQRQREGGRERGEFEH